MIRFWSVNFPLYALQYIFHDVYVLRKQIFAMELVGAK